MKKMKFNAAKLQLNKEKIAELNREQGEMIKGGYLKTEELSCRRTVDCVPFSIGCPVFTQESGCKVSMISVCICED